MAAVSLRRYTNLAALIDLLTTRQITLLSPTLWDDRNDAFFMRQYKNKTGARTVLALCFAETHETYHHWRVFSHGPDGVCIEFDKSALIESFADDKCITSKRVAYRQIPKLSASSVKLNSLPFIKRFPYRDEKEFRIVYTDMTTETEFKKYDLPLSSIRRVNLSPWMPLSLSDSVRKTIRLIKGCNRLPISRSTLVDNERWKQVAASIEP